MYILNLANVICQLYLNKSWEKIFLIYKRSCSIMKVISIKWKEIFTTYQKKLKQIVLKGIQDFLCLDLDKNRRQRARW